MVRGSGESSGLITVTGTVPPLSVLVISEIKQNTDDCQTDSWGPLGLMDQLDESLTSEWWCLAVREGQSEAHLSPGT